MAYNVDWNGKLNDTVKNCANRNNEIIDTVDICRIILFWWNMDKRHCWFSFEKFVPTKS